MLNLFLTGNLKSSTFINSVEPDEMLHFAASHLALHHIRWLFYSVICKFYFYKKFNTSSLKIFTCNEPFLTFDYIKLDGMLHQSRNGEWIIREHCHHILLNKFSVYKNAYWMHQYGVGLSMTKVM